MRTINTIKLSDNKTLIPLLTPTIKAIHLKLNQLQVMACLLPIWKSNCTKMKKVNFSTSKVLLIILGVLVAIIVIGFGSNVTGKENKGLEWEKPTKELIQKSLYKPVEEISSLFNGYLFRRN